MMDAQSAATAASSSPEPSTGTASRSDQDYDDADAAGAGMLDGDHSLAASLYSDHHLDGGDHHQSHHSEDKTIYDATQNTVTGSTNSSSSKSKCDSLCGSFCGSRGFILLVVILVAAAAGTTTYFVLHNNHEDQANEQIDLMAEQVLATSENNLMAIASILSAMSSSMTVMADAAGQANWPFYTQPDFAGAFGESYLSNTGARLILWSPVVKGDDERLEWDMYSSAHYHDWAGDDSHPTMMSPVIFEQNESGHSIPSQGAGPFVPVWQMIPVEQPQVHSTVNLNLLSNEAFQRTFQHLTEHKGSQVLSEISELTINGQHQSDPSSMLLTPIFKDPQRNEDMVGVLVAVLPWTDIFGDILLPYDQNATVVVSAEGCNDDTTSYTFSVSGGKSSFMGSGDLHDEEYDEYSVSAPFGQSIFNADSENDATACVHSLTVYPTDHVAGVGTSNEDHTVIIWIVVVVAVVLLSAIIFFLYDWSARRKHRQTQELSAKTLAIISSLYPAAIRDRILGRKTSKKQENVSSETPMPTSKIESSMYRLKSYLKEENKANETNSKDVDTEQNQQKILEVADMYDTKPIADLFPNTTVMFADIAGFTAWSSVREPSQVFTLLETVYAAFDSIAKRRRVFKVETVGDCYVAVTGLPEPRKDHAVSMARFSKECVLKFNELAKQLETTLGPDTGDLAIRAGLHSGPVTAGVLRGEKSRFQLFGDTVNTAARVEATGMRNRVHLSTDTAELLIEAGKEHWVNKRAEIVTAKGKGEIQTYWLVTPGQNETVDQARGTGVNGPEYMAANISSNTSLEDLEASLPPKIQRLVGWNVEILKRQLQQIIAKRNCVNSNRNYDLPVKRLEMELKNRKQLLGEITEVIALPKFDPTAHKNQEPSNKIPIPDVVMKELRLYVCSIAASHRDVPFHNFEHASHVTMSVSKLLSRIVAPSDILDQQNDKGGKDDLHAALHDHTFGINSDPLTQFAVVLSALIHDVDHHGVSNGQLVKEQHQLAKFFKDKSVAEQNSVVLAWTKLMSPPFENLRRCIYSTPSELERFRQIVVNNVLATDIFDKELNALRRNRWDKAFANAGTAVGGAGGAAAVSANGGKSHGHDTATNANRKATVVMEHLIQASDVSHTMQHWHIYQKWNERLFAEMTLAYQSGRLGFDPAAGWYQGELGFLDNYIIPLARKLKDCGVFGVSSDEYLNYALENRREWANKGEEVVERYAAQYCSNNKNNKNNKEDAEAEQKPKKEDQETVTSSKSPVE